jgi:hypothetical protein
MNIRRTFTRGMVTAAAAALATTALGGIAHAEGPFREVRTFSNKCLDVRTEDPTIGARVQQWNCTNHAEQHWALARRTADGIGRPLYSLRVDRGKTCMYVLGASTFPGAEIRQNTCSSTWDRSDPVAGAELWFFDVINGNLNIRNYRSGQCLDVTGGSSANGKLIFQNICSGATTQRITLASDAFNGA